MKYRKRCRAARSLRYQDGIVWIRGLITNFALNFAGRVDNYVSVDLEHRCREGHTTNIAASVGTLYGDGFGRGCSHGIVDTSGNARVENFRNSHAQTCANPPSDSI